MLIVAQSVIGVMVGTKDIGFSLRLLSNLTLLRSLYPNFGGRDMS